MGSLASEQFGPPKVWPVWLLGHHISFAIYSTEKIRAELQRRGGMEDNSKIISYISQ